MKAPRTTHSAAQSHGHVDSWGQTTDGCECVREIGRTTWSVCAKPAVAVAVYPFGHGSPRNICQAHLRGALRKGTWYADDMVEIRDLDGNQTHRLIRGAGRRGRMSAVPS